MEGKALFILPVAEGDGEGDRSRSEWWRGFARFPTSPSTIGYANGPLPMRLRRTGRI
jgi:hypothetical protein